MADSLTCQRCHQPLLRDPTVANLTSSQYALIAGTLPAAPRAPQVAPATKLAQQPPGARDAAAAWGAANPIAESYVFLPELAPPQQQRTASPGLLASASSSTSRAASPTAPPLGGTALAAKLDTLLSRRTEIDHPLCTECTGLFQAQLQRELEELTRERDAYIAFERNLRLRAEERGGAGGEVDDEGGVGGSDEWDALVQHRAELEEEEKRLTATLGEREAELASVQEEEKRVKVDEAAVERDEAEFLKSHAELATQLTQLSHALSSAKTQLLLSTSLLQHLESTNVYNDAFQIGHAPLQADGGRSAVTVGTINGLRLGGRPTVEWDEINAAWGLVALCIDRLAVKVGCVFETYKIAPLGSFSHMEELSGKGSYELYASSDLSPARLLQNRRFNHALVALLDCLRQLVEFGRSSGRAWAAGSIEINKDRINGYSIRLPGLASGLPALGSMSLMGLGSTEAAGKDNSSADEQWTRACRAVLQVLKRILVVESEAGRGTA
ncbi:Vacuolar protein sorting-associated protein 30 [Vanrija pseudolonga]|uniref:Vacuolar protein sorting-associated protein 30 n=1 Tax=Vanrija pseudolonga TaxID=143232 RepID=A0AAF0Y3D1_9TREE|nr:Vacuolar protein sorting-associated protein 30 [Vanrija pseudolonga]